MNLMNRVRPRRVPLRLDGFLLSAIVLLGRATAAPPVVSSANDFGAQAGAADNAPMLQRGLDSLASHGGGTLVIPAGTFRSGPIRLPSGVTLQLAASATLVMTSAPDDKPTAKGDPPAFITLSDAKNVRIIGEGTIDGNGQAWWDAFLLAKAASRDFRRPQLIRIDRCTDIELSGITTINPPNTHVSARDSSHVVFRGLTMKAPDDSPNTDAINIGRVKHVLIEKCEISTGDDNVAIIASGKAGPAPACEDITIRDCTFGFGHGLSIGSYTSAGIRGLRVERVTFDGTTSGIRLKSNAGRGGAVGDLQYRHLTMTNVRYPIFIASHYPKLPVEPADDEAKGGELPHWSDILIEDVTLRKCKNGPIVWGLPKVPVERLTLRRVAIESEQGGVIVHGQAVLECVTWNLPAGPPLRVFDAEVTGAECQPLEGRFKAK